VAAKRKETTIQWPLVSGDNADFFPYADSPHRFWSGYFTSRPALKRYIHACSMVYTAVRQMQVLAGSRSPANATALPALQKLEEALGVTQHHDAVSGTAKQHASFDYAQRLAAGQTQAEKVVADSLRVLVGEGPWVTCRLLNQSQCAATQDMDARGVYITLWNPLAQAQSQLVQLPVAGGHNYSVVAVGGGTNGAAVVDSQLYSAEEAVSNYQRFPGFLTAAMLAFVAAAPPLGTVTYLIAPIASGITTSGHQPVGIVAEAARETSAPPDDADVTLENEFISLTFSGLTGRLSSMTNKAAGLTTKVTQEFCSYVSNEGDIKSDSVSGAYIFRPDSSQKCSPIHALLSDKTDIKAVIRGGVVQAVRQEFSPWLTQTVQLAAGDRHAQFVFTVGAVDLIGDDFVARGHEIVSRFTADIASAGELLTDSNGREMLRRRRDYRPTWKLDQTEPVAGNYFPCNSAAAIRDTRAQLTVLVDSAQGVASIADGQLELMVHRRVLKDDHKGVGEPLDETESVTPYYGLPPHGYHYGPGLIVRGTHYVSLEAPTTAASVWRPLADSINGPLRPAFRAASAGSAIPAASATFSSLTTALPPNVQIITMQALGGASVLLRVAHQFGIGEDATLSLPTSVDLSKLFDRAAGITIINATEVSLTGAYLCTRVYARVRAW